MTARLDILRIACSSLWLTIAGTPNTKMLSANPLAAGLTVLPQLTSGSQTVSQSASSPFLLVLVDSFADARLVGTVRVSNRPTDAATVTLSRVGLRPEVLVEAIRTLRLASGRVERSGGKTVVAGLTTRKRYPPQSVVVRQWAQSLIAGLQGAPIRTIQGVGVRRALMVFMTPRLD